MIDNREGEFPTGSERYFASKYNRLRYKFPGSEKISENYSQSMQDLFVLSMLDGKKQGVYVEIGADKPKVINNSWMLELQYDWKGVSFEIDESKVEYFNIVRQNKCVCTDATTFDYKPLFDEREYPKQIDYLQVDCEPPEITLQCLKQLPLNDYRFSVITFETDLYDGGHEVEKEQWEILCSLGYQRVAKNVENEGNPYEDWWIDPEIVPEERWKPFMIDNVEFSKIILI